MRCGIAERARFQLIQVVGEPNPRSETTKTLFGSFATFSVYPPTMPVAPSWAGSSLRSYKTSPTILSKAG
jgi:hypothetical protein